MRAASHLPSGSAPLRIALVGGGHTHALLLLAHARRPLQGASITLISDVGAATYSGMLAGFVGGTYEAAACQIDLVRLARRAGAAFVQAAAHGLDRDGRQVLLAGGASCPYDVVSLNTGSAPALTDAGLPRHAVGVKPTDGFMREASRLISAAAEGQIRLLVVGGGVAGAELALCFKRRLAGAAQVTLLEKTERIAANLTANARGLLEEALADAGVTVLTRTALTEVDAAGFDGVIVATPGLPAPWLAGTGLALDDRGFVVVDQTLRSVSDPAVFSVGDVASMADTPHPKSGVYAVRHAATLEENLRRMLAGGALSRYSPQHKALVLINSGNGRAILARGRWAAAGRWVWWLKDAIDRRFISQFS